MGSARPADTASVSLAAKFHQPKYAPSACPRSPCWSMRPASRAPGRARSVPSAMPDRAQTSRKAPASPGPRVAAPTKATTASTMPASQVRASPSRRTSRIHSGKEAAALAKYSARKAGSMAGGACSRSCTKNSTSVAGMALARPLSTNTASSRRNAGRRSGSHRLAAGNACSARPRLGAGRGARNQASQPSASETASKAAVAGRPNRLGVTAASITPTRPSPSRQATSRARSGSSPPSMAPQAWCTMVSRLNAV